MKKWLSAALSLMAAFLVSGCGDITKAEMPPRYRFEIGKPLEYSLSGRLDLSVTAGFMGYQGLVSFEADLVLLPVEALSNGTRMELSIRDAKITGGDSRLVQQVFYSGLNQLRSSLAHVRIDDRGHATAIVQGTDNPGLSSYLQILFPEMTDHPASAGSANSRLETDMQGTPYVIIGSRDWTRIGSDEKGIEFSHRADFKGYVKSDYERSTEPQPKVTVQLNMRDVFDPARGALTQKNADLVLRIEMELKQGIFSVMLTGGGTGDLALTLKPSTNRSADGR